MGGFYFSNFFLNISEGGGINVLVLEISPSDFLLNEAGSQRP